MPKTTTFKYVSSKSSGSSFSPTSTENIASASSASASPSSLPSPTTTIYYSSSTIQQEKPERKPAPFSVGDRSTWLDATDSQPHEAFFYVELLCNIWFIVEFTTRFLVIIVYVKNDCSTVLSISSVHFIHCLWTCKHTHTNTFHSNFHWYIWSMKQTTGNPVDTLKTLFTNRFDYIVHNVYVVVHILTCSLHATYPNTHESYISWAIILTSWWNERAEWSVYAPRELAKLNAFSDYFLIYISNTQFLYLTTHIYLHALLLLLFLFRFFFFGAFVSNTSHRFHQTCWSLSNRQ